MWACQNFGKACPVPLPHTLKDDATSILKYAEKNIDTYKPL